MAMAMPGGQQGYSGDQQGYSAGQCGYSNDAAGNQGGGYGGYGNQGSYSSGLGHGYQGGGYGGCYGGQEGFGGYSAPLPCYNFGTQCAGYTPGAYEQWDDDDADTEYPTFNQGSGPVYAQYQLADYSIEGGLQITVRGKEGEVVPPPLNTFESCAPVLPEKLLQQFRIAGFTAPTAIQQSTWPVAFLGRDIIGVAKTGSGKTLAFLVPALVQLLSKSTRGIQCMVLSPTRELAVQIEAEAQKFGNPCGCRSVCLYGGASRGAQLGQLRRPPQIVVATPGRLNDFLESRQVDLSQVTYCVLDEADRMLDLGFEPQVRSILQKVSPSRQILFFAATWPKEVRSLASDFLTNPFKVSVGQDVIVANEDVSQNIIVVDNDEQKLDEVRKILEPLVKGNLVLIFCETKAGCAQLSDHLFKQYGIRCTAIHGDLSQRDRDYAIQSFKNGSRPIMVGTDVAGRGLDIKGITVVINFDPASSAQDYVHRIGRTGRVGIKGHSYTLLLRKQVKRAREVVQVMKAGSLQIPPDLQALIGGGNRGGNGRSKGGGKAKGSGKGSGKGKGRGKGGHGKAGGNFQGGGDRGGHGGQSVSQCAPP